jgi:hypothetical protein
LLSGLLGPEATSAGAGNGPDKTSPNAVRKISFQCKKGLTYTIQKRIEIFPDFLSLLLLIFSLYHRRQIQ